MKPPVDDFSMLGCLNGLPSLLLSLLVAAASISSSSGLIRARSSSELSASAVSSGRSWFRRGSAKAFCLEEIRQGGGKKQKCKKSCWELGFISRSHFLFFVFSLSSAISSAISRFSPSTLGKHWSGGGGGLAQVHASVPPLTAIAKFQFITTVTTTVQLILGRPHAQTQTHTHWCSLALTSMYSGDGASSLSALSTA